MTEIERKLVYSKLQNENGWMVYEEENMEEWIYMKKTGPKCKEIKSRLCNFFKEVFLPQGFPESVHPDYVPYQIWDTVQAFTSTILGTLTTHSIMQGVGVGESTATPLAAAITWILKDSTGMLGRILFVWWNGRELDAQCKKWRLFADVLNDFAMGMDLLLPYFPSWSTAILCFSSGMKSLVGVAGGATRAAITQHQALSNNLADVSAKDGSQETGVNLIASFVGVFLLSFLNASAYLEFYYVVLVALHIYANYSAVKSLHFNTFNEDRLALLVKHYLTRSIILPPDHINERESVLLFQRPSKKLCGFDIVLGESLDEFLSLVKTDETRSSFMAKTLKEYHMTRQLQNMIKMNPQLYKTPSDCSISLDMFFLDIENRRIYVALHHDTTPRDIINAYFKAFLHSIYLSMHLNLRPDIIKDAKSTTGPLSMLYKMQNEQLGERHSNIPKNIDMLITRETAKWTQLLDESEWVKDKNLLSIGPYRSYWDPSVLIQL